MAGNSDSGALRMKIAAHIEQTYRDTGCAVFVPEQFVEEGFGDAEAVVRALRDLEYEGELLAYTTVRCAAGHDFAGGRPAEVAQTAPRICNIIGCWTHELTEDEREEEEYQPRFILRYAMSQRWRRHVIGAGDQKKSPAELPA